MKSPCLVMILVLAVQLAGCSAAAGNDGAGSAGPSPGPELAVDITESSAEAQVTESETGTAAFSGTVTLQMPTVRGATVTLTSSTDIGWVTQVSPTNMVLDNGQTGSFTVAVVVPQGTPAAQDGNLQVNGRAVASGIQATGSDTAAVEVRPYYRVAIDAQKRTAEMVPGGTAHFSVRVINAGNSVDSFDLQFTNLEALRKDGWELARTTTSLESIDPGGFRTVGILLYAPAAYSPYLDSETTLTVKLVSMGARERNQTVLVDYPLVAREVGVSGVGLGAVGLGALLIAVGVVVFLRRRRRMIATAARALEDTPPEGSG